MLTKEEFKSGFTTMYNYLVVTSLAPLEQRYDGHFDSKDDASNCLGVPKNQVFSKRDYAKYVEFVNVRA